MTRDETLMKVLVADKFEQSGLDGLQAAGCDVVYQPELQGRALAQAIRDDGADVLVVRGTTVTGPMLEAGALVARRPRGRRLQHDRRRRPRPRRGIYVSNCPGKNAIAVAELAFALILALDRRIPDNVAELRAGKWNKKEYSKARGLFGRTLGLLGFGNIGQEMARRAHAFGMPVVGLEPPFRRRRADRAEQRGADRDRRAVAGGGRRARDVLSVHLALTAETRGLRRTRRSSTS